jgi:hypothetical protein
MTASQDPAPSDKDALCKVVYDEAVRALSEQQVVIDSVRGRAGYLLSAAAITTSVLSALALPSSSSSPMVWVALAAFVGVTAMSLVILQPRRPEISATPVDLIRNYVEIKEPARIHQLHRDLSVQIQRSYFENLEGLTELATLFQIASGLLVGEIVLWILVIVSIG